MGTNKHIVYIEYFWPDYWENFLHHCNDIAETNDWNIVTVINHQLKPHGKYIKTSLHGSYLRWDDPKYHTLFVLRWS